MRIRSGAVTNHGVKTVGQPPVPPRLHIHTLGYEKVHYRIDHGPIFKSGYGVTQLEKDGHNRSDTEISRFSDIKVLPLTPSQKQRNTITQV